ncbi:MAG: hypothetical protein AB7P40_13895 [Chloroflexota bacterium]
MYTVPSVGYSGPARIGAAISAAFMLIPCVLFGFAGAWLLHAARNLLDSWRNATIPVPIPLMSVNLSMNFIDLLSLHKVHDSLVYWDDRLWLTFAILWLVPWVLWIIAGVCFAVLVAAIYNLVGKLGGGMRVALRPIAVPSRSHMAAPGPGGPPPAGAWQNPGWPQEPRR